MATSPDPAPSPPSDPLSTSPLPPPSDGHDLFPKFSFPVMKPRSKRKPLKFSESHKEEAFEVGTVSSERPWKLRSIGLGRKQRTRFSLPLSSEEIEEDIYAVTGSRPRRRPKKRPRHVQKQIDMVFPGLWLSEVTAELYRVAEDR